MTSGMRKTLLTQENIHVIVGILDPYLCTCKFMYAQTEVGVGTQPGKSRAGLKQ